MARGGPEDFDLLVLGAGMAGLTAAARAARSGAAVALVEKADAVGGSAAYAGFIWTAPTHEAMREANPDGAAVLTEKLVDDFDAGVEWARSLGVAVGELVPVLGFGRGRQTDMAGYLMACERELRAGRGCEL